MRGSTKGDCCERRESTHRDDGGCGDQRPKLPTNAQSCLVLLDAVNKLTDIVGTMVEEQAMQEARISMLEADMVKK